MADKTHKKEVRRQHRQEERDRRAREARRQSLFVWGGLGAIVLLTSFVVLRAINPANQPGTFVANLGNQHLSAVDESHVPYNSTPPTSGPHVGRAPWGVSERQIPNEEQVHNLEDCGVILQYDCPEGCAELTNELTALANQVLTDSSFANQRSEVPFILAPYFGIRAASGGKPIALTAWQRIQYFDKVDREAMLTFIRAHINIDHHVGGGGRC